MRSRTGGTRQLAAQGHGPAVRRSTSTTAARSRSSRTPTRRAARTSTSRRPAARRGELQPRRRRRQRTTALSNTKAFTLVVPGDYTVTEAAKARWELTGLRCDDGNSEVNVDTGVATIDVGSNEHVTCTFTNTKLGKIIVEKQTEPDGSAGSFVFTGDVAGSIGDGGQIVVNDLLPGTYTSTENDPAPPFDLGTITCDDNDSDGDLATRTATFELEAGETIKCTFVNVKRGSITIIKDAQPNDAQDFAFTTTGAGLSGFSLDDDADGTLQATKTFSNVKPGAYSVTEGEVTSWELTGLTCEGTNGSTGVKSGSTANIDLKAGGSVTCTFMNVKAGRIIVDKVTNPAADPASFEFDPSYGANFTLTDAQTPNDSGDLKPGTYSVVELAKAGWDLSTATCSDGSPVEAISLQAGETVTCTFTNIKRGHIIIDKVTVPSGDPAAVHLHAVVQRRADLPAGGRHRADDSGALVPGTYSSPRAVTDWTQTSATCTDGSPVSAISLAAGRDRHLHVHQHQARHDHHRQGDRAGRLKPAVHLHAVLQRRADLPVGRRHGAEQQRRAPRRHLLRLRGHCGRLGPDERDMRRRQPHQRHQPPAG